MRPSWLFVTALSEHGFFFSPTQSFPSSAFTGIGLQPPVSLTVRILNPPNFCQRFRSLCFLFSFCTTVFHPSFLSCTHHYRGELVNVAGPFGGIPPRHGVSPPSPYNTDLRSFSFNVTLCRSCPPLFSPLLKHKPPRFFAPPDHPKFPPSSVFRGLHRTQECVKG